LFERFAVPAGIVSRSEASSKQQRKKNLNNLYLYTRKVGPVDGKPRQKNGQNEIVSEISINYEAQKDVSAC
jgi:hypothetical protein